MRKPDIDLMIAYLLLWTLTTVSIFIWMITP